VSLFTYILAKAQIPDMYAELMIIKALTVEPFTFNQEGFMICKYFYSS
jgi:hypothetical protein